MSEPDLGWTATLTVRVAEGAWAEWLFRALQPEVAREVPRARAELRSTGSDRFEIALTARDTGSIRAAMNTYLGWVDLALATAARARSPP